MLIKNSDNFYKSTLLLGFEDLIQGFSTTYLGDMRFTTENGRLNREKLFGLLSIKENEVVRLGQVHGSKISVVGKEWAGSTLADTDGVVTNEKRTICSVLTADCLPILAYDQKKKIIGIAHAGWRSTLKGIARNLIKEMIGLGSEPGGILISFGPGISVGNYEIKEDVGKEFALAGQKNVIDLRKDKLYLDLRKANIAQLTDCGISLSSVESNSEADTFSNKDFFSWRREKPELAGEIISLIGLC